MADELGMASIGVEVDLSKVKSGFDDAKQIAADGADAAGDAATSALGESLGGAEAVAGDAGAAAGASFGDKLLLGIGGAAALIGTALVGIGIAAFGMATDVNQSTNDIQAAFGTTREEAEALSDVAVAVFGNNFGDNMSDVTESLIAVRQQMRGLADEDLQSVTEHALAVRDVFGIDVSESTAAANTLMEQFGLTSDEAFDFIVAGNQRGLNASGDFLDTINEYGVQFASGGADAGQFFSLMESGLASGVLGTDKAADAFKEFRIRITEGSDEAAGALTDLGIDADDFYAGMADGSITAADGFQQVMQGLNNISDPIERNRIGTQLLGTQWEDLGPTLASSLTLAGTSMNDLAGATDTLNAKYNNFGSMWEGIKRQALVALLPLGEKLLEFANRIMPLVSAAFGWLQTGLPPIIDSVIAGFGTVGGAIQPIITFVGDLISSVTTGFSDAGVLGAIMALIGRVGEISPAFQFLSGVISTALPAIQSVVQGVFGMVATFISTHGQEIVGFVQTAWGQIQSIIDTVATLVGSIVSTVFGAIATFISTHGDEIQGILTLAWQTIQTVVQAALDVIQGIILPALEGIASFISTHSDQIQTVIGAAWDIIRGVVEAALSVIQGVIQTVTAVIHGDWEGAWNAIKTMVDGVWNGISSVIDGALTIIKGLLSTAWDAIKTLAETMWNGIKDAISGIWTGIKTGIDTIVGEIKSLLSGAWESVKSVATDMWNAVKDAIIGPIKAAYEELLSWVQPFIDIGRALIGGVADGITIDSGFVVDAAVSAVNAAKAAAEAEADINSPSRVWREDIGQMIGVAPALGIEDMIPRIETAARRMVAAARGESVQGLALSGGTLTLPGLTMPTNTDSLSLRDTRQMASGSVGATTSIVVDARGATNPAEIEAAGYRGAQRAIKEYTDRAVVRRRL